MHKGSWAIFIAAMLGPVSVPAAVKSTSGQGFAVESSVEIAADAAAVYALLVTPARWWSGEHSYSGNAANLTLEPRAGGCFCEALPDAGGKPGSVEHARVILAMPGRQLRLSGALGPLQAEAVTGTLNFDIQPAGSGVRVTLSYGVSGSMGMGAERLAPVVDQVLTEQLAGLKRAAEAGGR